MQRHPNSKFSNSTRKTPHAVVIFPGRTRQFGQIQQIQEQIFSPNRRRMVPAKNPPVQRRPSSTYTRIVFSSQNKRRILPRFGSSLHKNPIHTRIRFGQKNRIRPGVDLHQHYKKRTPVHRSGNKVEKIVFRIRKTFVSARTSTKRRQQVEDPQSQSRDLHGHTLGT